MKFNELTLKKKIIGGYLFILIFVCIGLGLISAKSVSNIVLGQIQQNIPSMATEGARLIRSQLDKNIVAIEGIANRSVIKSGNWETEQLPALSNELTRMGYLGIGIVDKSGQARYVDGSTASLGDRDYVKNAFNGKTVFSNVLISRVINAPVLMLATPIYNENKQINEVLIARLGATLLSDITDNIKYGVNGYSYVIDNKGTLIAHDNRDFVLEQRNFIEESESDPQYIPLANMFKKMINGDSGFDDYPFMGYNRFFGYAPIAGTDWSIAVGAMKDDVFKDIYWLNWVIFIVSALFLIVGIIIAFLISNSIIKSINLIVIMLKDISEGEGDLTKRININSNDELGHMALYFNKFVEKLQIMVKSLTNNAMQISDSANELLTISTETADNSQNMSQKTQTAVTSAEEISTSTNMIASSTEQAANSVRTVATAAVQMSSNINTVASGAEQASVNVESIVNAVKNISDNIKVIITKIEGVTDNTNNSASAVEEMSVSLSEVAKITNKAKEISDKADTQAKNTAQIMETLRQNAQEIGGVIKIINDIADQTNMLALNATIEAASAGDAGKGFAVVANEVKTLAKQTAEATDKIQTRIIEMQNSTNTTVDSLKVVQDIISELNDINVTIASTVEEQSATVMEISKSISKAADNSKEVYTFTEEIGTSAETANRNILEAGQGINEIARNIAEASTVANTVAQNSEEVSVGVDDIAKNITEINIGINEISNNLTDINLSANETAVQSGNVEKASMKLEELVNIINKLLAQFKI